MSTTTAPSSEAASAAPVRFETRPEAYRHWSFQVEGPVARLGMQVSEHEGLRSDYELKLNSYDLSVDIELADVTRRLRFEHPGVRTLVVESSVPRIFCAGANIHMLGSSTHGFKVNFCKFTNETRLYLEDMAAECGIRTLAALNGTCAGGGYELALACDEIVLQDDGNTAVSLPEVPLLGVLPGTGGLTRLVDKRKVRRDLADVFSTVAEGIKGRRAEQWNLVDKVVPSSRFAEFVTERAQELAQGDGPRGRTANAEGVVLEPLGGTYEQGGVTHRNVTLAIDGRVGTITIKGPDAPPPADPAAARANANDLWTLRTARELDDVLLDLRFNRPDVGTLILKTEGDAAQVLAWDAFLAEHAEDDWFVFEILATWKRVLKRVDLSARSLFALIEPGSCFAGTLFDLTLACDRSYMLDDPDHPVSIELSALNRGPLPMSNGLTRLETRFLGAPDTLAAALAHEGPWDARDAEDAGVVTISPDDIDWEDEVRIAIEERASLSPDALTGMEANIRFAGPETLETKIFGRLSAWQNWIFQRPNAVGEQGALTLYGRPERPVYDWSRT
ncbi:MAG: 2,3-epoxybenzoyl-CoA dihydrolase [Planctomycetota bacterium]|nr:2,3-epoxybenzoyl-CoA dihydrolase [Planctomycetota bacterium]